MPEFGEMPMGIWPPARPSRVRWLLVLLLSVVVVGSLLPEGLELESSIISLEFVESLICKEAGCFFSAAEAIVVMARGCWRCRRLHLTGWVRAHCGGHRDGGAGACVRGRRPADVVVLLHPLAEGRLFLIPPGYGAIWEAVLLLVGSHGVALWRPRRPKWLVPRRRRVSELGPEDTSRNIIEIIFQSSWLKKQSPVCAVDRILKVHNAPATLARFEAYRDAVKARARGGRPGAGRCTADGNELLRFHCAALACSLGAGGATHLCDGAGNSSCAACGIVRNGFKFRAPGVRTMATSGRAHDDAVGGEEGEVGGGERRRAMLVCRVIAGRVKRRCEGAAGKEEVEESPSAEEAETEGTESSSEYDSVAGTAGVYSSLDELEVFNPTAILPCFVVVYKA